MHASHDDDHVIVNAIKDSIREPMEKRPSGISMNDRVHGRMGNYVVADCLHGLQKLITQARTLTLIPEKCLIDIRSSRWTGNDWYHKVRLRIR